MFTSTHMNQAQILKCLHCWLLMQKKKKSCKYQSNKHYAVSLAIAYAGKHVFMEGFFVGCGSTNHPHPLLLPFTPPHSSYTVFLLYFSDYNHPLLVWTFNSPVPPVHSYRLIRIISLPLSDDTGAVVVWLTLCFTSAPCTEWNVLKWLRMGFCKNGEGYLQAVSNQV